MPVELIADALFSEAFQTRRKTDIPSSPCLKMVADSCYRRGKHYQKSAYDFYNQQISDDEIRRVLEEEERRKAEELRERQRREATRVVKLFLSDLMSEVVEQGELRKELNNAAGELVEEVLSEAVQHVAKEEIEAEKQRTLEEEARKEAEVREAVSALLEEMVTWVHEHPLPETRQTQTDGKWMLEKDELFMGFSGDVQNEKVDQRNKGSKLNKGTQVAVVVAKSRGMQTEKIPGEKGEQVFGVLKSNARMHQLKGDSNKTWLIQTEFVEMRQESVQTSNESNSLPKDLSVIRLIGEASLDTKSPRKSAETKTKFVQVRWVIVTVDDGTQTDPSWPIFIESDQETNLVQVTDSSGGREDTVAEVVTTLHGDASSGKKDEMVQAMVLQEEVELEEEHVEEEVLLSPIRSPTPPPVIVPSPIPTPSLSPVESLPPTPSSPPPPLPPQKRFSMPELGDKERREKQLKTFDIVPREMKPLEVQTLTITQRLQIKTLAVAKDNLKEIERDMAEIQQLIKSPPPPAKKKKVRSRFLSLGKLPPRPALFRQSRKFSV